MCTGHTHGGTSRPTRRTMTASTASASGASQIKRTVLRPSVSMLPPSSQPSNRPATIAAAKRVMVRRAVERASDAKSYSDHPGAKRKIGHSWGRLSREWRRSEGERILGANRDGHSQEASQNDERAEIGVLQASHRCPSLSADPGPGWRGGHPIIGRPPRVTPTVRPPDSHLYCPSRRVAWHRRQEGSGDRSPYPARRATNCHRS